MYFKNHWSSISQPLYLQYVAQIIFGKKRMAHVC